MGNNCCTNERNDEYEIIKTGGFTTEDEAAKVIQKRWRDKKRLGNENSSTKSTILIPRTHI